MGAWGARLYENDTALDIKDRFADLRKGKTVQQITNELIEEYTCELDDVFCAPVFLVCFGRHSMEFRAVIARGKRTGSCMA
ncbi:MAG: DUF4259 domain-containing protein [Acutalibacteraceae bacterium]